MPVFQRKHMCFAVSGLSAAIVSLYIFLGNGIDLPIFLYEVVDMFRPRNTVNFILHIPFLSLTPQIIFYWASFMIALLVIVYHLIRCLYSDKRFDVRFLLDDIFRSVCGLLVLGLVIQTAVHVNLAKNLYMQNIDRPVEQRYIATFQDVHLFAQFCKLHIDPQKTVAYTTDLDLDNDPGQFLHRLSAYFLYPIDMRNIRGMRDGDADYIICFIKKYEPENIPEGYRLYAQYTKDAYILKRI